MTGRSLFVTGAQRSGTTLLEKLLSCHPEVSLLSQPFPYLFLEAKQAFLRSLGCPPARYPLGDLFLETRYEPGDFADFVADFVVEESRLLALFADMQGYSGQYTRLPPAAVEAAAVVLRGRPLGPLVRQLYRVLAPRPQAPITGGKEVLCEEFLSPLLAGGFSAALILRDPRDMIASLNHGRGPEHGGRLKPTLFNLRNWRKSVAHLLALAATPRCAWVRYEDLVVDARGCLAAVLQALDLELEQDLPSELVLSDGMGRTWAGNSSRGPRTAIDDASVGAFRDTLPPEVIRYVEAACWPEMRVLGYATELERRQIPGCLVDFVDPYPLERPELAGYLDPSRADEELRRFAMLDDPEDASSRPWFLLPGVHRRLSSGVRVVGAGHVAGREP
jgi:hypothetical protein